MKNLKTFLDNELEKDVMDVVIYAEDGKFLKEPNYSKLKVISYNYEKRADGKYCIIKVKYII